MTLNEKHVRELLEASTPGPWKAHDDYVDLDINPDVYQMQDSKGDYLGLMHGHDAYLAALAPQLAQEVLRMREALHDLSEVWEAISIGPYRTPAEQQLAAAVVDHIDQILGDHND